MKSASSLLVAAVGAACFPAAAQTARAPSLCATSEEAIFSCALKGPSRNLVSLCASPGPAQGKRSFYYQYGRPSKIELRYPARGDGHEAFTFTRLFYAGGTFGHAYSFKNGGYKYIVYSIEGITNRSGLSIQREGQLHAAREMACEPSNFAETKKPNLLRITSEWKADEDIEAHGLPSTR